MSSAGAVVGSRVWSWFSVLVRDRCEFCVTESRWAQRRAPRTGARVRAPGHSPRAPAPRWCPAARGSACCERYPGYKWRTTASEPGHCLPCQTCTRLTKLSRSRLIRRATRRRPLPAPTQTRALTRRRARCPAPRSRWAGSTPRTPCLHISGQ